MEEGIDTGPIIARTVVPVSVADTMETVIETLKRAVPTLLEMTLKNLRNPDFKPELQDEIVATYESRPQNL
jgi:methionyl-tRNA formyltransferase